LLAALRGGRPTLPESQWTPYAVVLQVALEALWLLFVYLLVTRKYQRPFWSSMHWFGLHGREPSFFFSGVGLAIFVQLYSALFPPERHMPIEDWFTNARSAYIVALFGICIA